jgi:hypothetical protein
VGQRNPHHSCPGGMGRGDSSSPGDGTITTCQRVEDCNTKVRRSSVEPFASIPSKLRSLSSCSLGASGLRVTLHESVSGECGHLIWPHFGHLSS